MKLESLCFFVPEAFADYSPDRLDGGRDLGQQPWFLPDDRLERAQDLPDLWETYGDKEFEITELLDGVPIMVYQVKHDGHYKDLPGMLVDDSTGLIRKRSEIGISIRHHDYEETEDSSSWAVLRKQGVISTLRKYQQAEEVILVGVLCGRGILGRSSRDQWPPILRAFFCFTRPQTAPPS